MNSRTIAKQSTILPSSVALSLVGGTAFALGVLFATGNDATRSDWLSFSGALIGAAVTVLGSVFVIEWQRTREARERTKLLTSLFDDAEIECAAFHVANEQALKKRYGLSTADQVRKTQAAIDRIHRFFETFTPETVQMMKLADELADLSFDDPTLEEQMRSFRLYPESADFGGLNAIGHEVVSKIARARRLLTD